MYIGENEMFWEWTEEIYQMARCQVTEAGIKEALVCALKRAREMDIDLPDSPISSFYKLFGDAGIILSGCTNAGDKYKFTIAYGKLCTTLPYVAYHGTTSLLPLS